MIYYYHTILSRSCQESQLIWCWWNNDTQILSNQVKQNPSKISRDHMVHFLHSKLPPRWHLFVSVLWTLTVFNVLPLGSLQLQHVRIVIVTPSLLTWISKIFQISSGILNYESLHLFCYAWTLFKLSLRCVRDWIFAEEAAGSASDAHPSFVLWLYNMIEHRHVKSIREYRWLMLVLNLT